MSYSIGWWPFSFTIHPQVSSARRAFYSIISKQRVTHKADINTYELIALLWIAIHDDTMRKGSLYDARRRFIQCLSEMTNTTGSSYICAGGMYNKLMETLDGIHLMFVLNILPLRCLIIN